jgi:hypothetical protein
LVLRLLVVQSGWRSVNDLRKLTRLRSAGKEEADLQ